MFAMPSVGSNFQPRVCTCTNIKISMLIQTLLGLKVDLQSLILNPKFEVSALHLPVGLCRTWSKNPGDPFSQVSYLVRQSVVSRSIANVSHYLTGMRQLETSSRRFRDINAIYTLPFEWWTFMRPFYEIRLNFHRIMYLSHRLFKK